MASYDWIDKLFASPMFWTLMSLQAVGTGGFLFLAVAMDIKYMEAQDSPGSTYIAAYTVFAIPVACFCFFFAGASFFNVFSTVSSCKKVTGMSNSCPLLPGKNKATATLATAITQDGQVMA